MAALLFRSLFLCLFKPFVWNSDRPFRSSQQGCSVKKGVPRNFAKFFGKYLCQSLFFNKEAEACNFIKKGTTHRYFPVNLRNFLEHFFYRVAPGDCFCPLMQETLGWSDCNMELNSFPFRQYLLLCRPDSKILIKS